MTRSRRLYFLLGLAVLLLCAAAAAPRARALWAQLPSGEWIEAADCAARREAPAPGRDALRVVFRAWRGSELMEERVLESAV